MNGRRGGEDLAVLIERSAELKRDLVDFACSPRWERSLAAAMAEAGLEEIDEGDAISTAFFGGDELVLPPGEAEERLNAYYRQRQEAALARRPARRRPPSLPGVDVPAFEFPPDLREAGTIGIIFDDVDG